MMQKGNSGSSLMKTMYGFHPAPKLLDTPQNGGDLILLGDQTTIQANLK